MTCLHLAVKTGNLELVLLLLFEKVNVNVIDKFNRTPLYLSFFNINFDIQIALLLFKADPYSKFNDINNKYFIKNINIFKLKWNKMFCFNSLKLAKADVILPNEYIDTFEKINKIYYNKFNKKLFFI